MFVYMRQNCHHEAIWWWWSEIVRSKLQLKIADLPNRFDIQSRKYTRSEYHSPDDSGNVGFCSDNAEMGLCSATLHGIWLVELDSGEVRNKLETLYGLPWNINDVGLS